VRTREDECSATVDLFSYDLVYGNATFIKSGAAPSYMKRGPEVFRVRSRTMPLGLLKTPDAERINVEVHAGDILVLLSDGIAPENEDPAWLISLLAEEDGTDLQALATRIVAEAVSRGERDDSTVGLVRISLAG
jgi:stage II sporulation protein E